MQPSDAKLIFDELYSDVSGRTLSLSDRESQKLTSKSFVYGEVVFDSFYQLMKEAEPNPGGVFCDLGSGTGKAVFLAHLLFDFSRAVGIEYLRSLYDASMDVLNRYERDVRPKIRGFVDDRKVQFVLGDLVLVDLSEVDFVFMNSTCFQDDLMHAAEERIMTVRPGTKIITLTKSLKSPQFELVKQKLFDFSWGQATAFFQIRK